MRNHSQNRIARYISTLTASCRAAKVASLVAVCAAGVFGGVGSASAATIYSDDFSGSSSTDLNGTTPDVSTTLAKWVAASSVKADGSFGTTDTDYTATLAFTPEDNKTYALEASIVGLTGITR